MCPGNKNHGIDPNMSNSGHHDCSRKPVFLCTADKLQCWPMLARNGTHWRMLAFSFLHLSFIIFIRTIASVVLSSSYSFENSPWASLGRILVHNHTITLMSTKAWGKLSLGKPATITFGKNKDVNSSIKFRL